MQTTLKLFAAIIICGALAAWVRMFEASTLFPPLNELIHAPINEILGALISGPLFEIVGHFPAYIIASAFYFITINAVKPKPNISSSLLIGCIAAFITFISFAFILEMWVMKGVYYTLRILFLYTSIGAIFGALSHRLGLNQWKSS